MTSSAISMRVSYKAECRVWYEQRLHIGVAPEQAKGYVYSWHEEGDPNECKIGYCTKDPFVYLWEGSALSHQKRLPVIFLSVGFASLAEAKAFEGAMHAELEHKHMLRSCAREWFQASKEEVCSLAQRLATRTPVGGLVQPEASAAAGVRTEA